MPVWWEKSGWRKKGNFECYCYYISYLSTNNFNWYELNWLTLSGTWSLGRPPSQTYQFFCHTPLLLDVYGTSTNRHGWRRSHGLHYVDQHQCRCICDADDDHEPTHTNNSTPWHTNEQNRNDSVKRMGQIAIASFTIRIDCLLPVQQACATTRGKVLVEL